MQFTAHRRPQRLCVCMLHAPPVCGWSCPVMSACCPAAALTLNPKKHQPARLGLPGTQERSAPLAASAPPGAVWLRQQLELSLFQRPAVAAVKCAARCVSCHDWPVTYSQCSFLVNLACVSHESAKLDPGSATNFRENKGITASFVVVNHAGLLPTDILAVRNLADRLSGSVRP